MAELGVEPAGPPLAVYFNTDIKDLDVEIGIPVVTPMTGRGEIQAGGIPGGPAVSAG